ncbi:MAG TPA: DUF456 family protein [Chthoniobacteraceae bacterium]|nr:DUF456 family protein [Chthoniobacteraceae bacterium]
MNLSPSALTTLWWTLTLVVMFLGLVGTVLPLLPGTTIILLAAVGHHFVLGPDKSVGWFTISGLAVLTIISYVLDFVSGTLGAKKFGATRWGAIGGILGAIVGLFFGLPGIFIGPLVGVLLGELLGGKGLLPAGKSTWGTFLGTTAGIVAKLIIAALMIGWFLLAALWK